MAQTVALQRGTGTLSTTGTTSVTLFTQSGGLATRVIFNQLTWYLNAGTSSAGMTAILCLNSSGGQSSVIALYRANSSTMWGGNFVNKNNGNPMPRSIYNGSGMVMSTSSMYQQSAAQAIGTNAGTVTINQGSSYIDTMPTNFWIGPSDALTFKMSANNPAGKGTSPLTCTYSYSFTTITES
jgi:hypothetical protein